MTPRIATTADLAPLARVINVAYRVEAFFVEGDRTSELELTTMMGTGDFLVIDLAERPVAAAIYAELRGARAYFGMLSVDPAHQKQGLARTLILAVEERCRAAGCKFLDINVVNLRAELPAFYHALGYAAFDVAPFPTPARLTRAAHLVKMTKPLVPLFD